MNIRALSVAAKAELGRALREHKYEVSPRGLFFPKAGLFVGGAFRSWLNGKDERVDANIVPNVMLSAILSASWAGGTQISSWYIAPFSGASSPAADLTAANFNSRHTEFTNYDETTRVAWARDAESGQSISNDTTKAEFTISTGGGTVTGAAMISVATKSATTGTLSCASKFGADRVMVAADVLSLEYAVTAADA